MAFILSYFNSWFFIAPNFSFLTIGNPFINPQERFGTSLFLYILFLPNIQLIIIGAIAYCAQAWSIGIEEYLYLLWPFVIQKISIFKTYAIIIVIILLYIISIYILAKLMNGRWHSILYLDKFFLLLTQAIKFDSLLIGSLFALLNFQNRYWYFITNKYFQIGIILAIIYLIYKSDTFNGFFWEIHAVLYGFLIFNLVKINTSIINFEIPVFNFLGKITYGIYMYQFIVVEILIKILYKFNVSFLVYPLSILFSILISTLSYYYFESFFLNKKNKYSKIATG